MTSLFLPALLSLYLLHAEACTNFLMENSYRVSVRTKDLGGAHEFGWLTVPRGAVDPLGRHTRLGFVGAAAITTNGRVDDSTLSAGLNERGLSCDTQTLLGTIYEPKTANASRTLRSLSFCNWALGHFSTSVEVAAALPNVTVWGACGGDDHDCKHVVVRDASGQSLVVEWLRGEATVRVDDNDGGRTGFGVLTNEPPFDWQVENARHYLWKQSLARHATAIPGAFYPDERFLRVAQLKSAMASPSSLREAVMQAVHVLNSVTVPMGLQRGTDSGPGEGAADHTIFGVIYDHRTPQLWWRTQSNQQLQRLRLADADLAIGAAPAFLPMDNALVPWSADAAAALGPIPSE